MSFRRAIPLFMRLASTSKFPRTAFLATGGTTLGVSLFAKSENTELSSRPKNYEIVVRDSDELYDNYLIDNAYNILKRFGSGNCSELLWRLARVLCEKAKISKNEEEKKILFYESFAVVKKALEHEPKEGCFGAHKWYAIILDYIGSIEGNKSRIEKSYEVKEHLEQAIKIYESDPTTWHILGVWHFSFADMSYPVRLVAKTIFASPPSSTYENALHYFLEAEKISPSFYSTNLFYIAEVYDRLGNKSDAIEYYKRAFKMPVITVDDADVHKKVHEKLRKYKVSDAQLL